MKQSMFSNGCLRRHQFAIAWNNKRVRKLYSWGELSSTFMNRPGVTINCLIKRYANYVEKNEKKSPLGAGNLPDSRAIPAIQ